MEISIVVIFLIFCGVILFFATTTFAADKERYGSRTALVRLLFWQIYLVQDVLLEILPEDEEDRFLCPFCTETVEREAKDCPHCHKDLTGYEPIKFAEEDGGLTNWEYNGLVISKRGQDYYVADDPHGYARLDIAKSVIDSGLRR